MAKHQSCQAATDTPLTKTQDRNLTSQRALDYTDQIWLLICLNL